jgi:hypothetical protein
VNHVPAGWMRPHLWGVFSSCITEGQLNVSGSIVTLSGLDEGDNVGEKSAVKIKEADQSCYCQTKDFHDRGCCWSESDQWRPSNAKT